MTFLSILWFSNEEFRANLLFYKVSRPVKRVTEVTESNDNIIPEQKSHENDTEPLTYGSNDSNISRSNDHGVDDKSVNVIENKDPQKKHHHIREVKLNLTELQENVNHNLYKINKRGKRADFQYFNLSKHKQNHCDFEFLINGSNICRSIDPFLIILVPSAPHKVKERLAIRDSWGRYSGDEKLSSPHNASKVALAFLIGKDANYSTNEREQTFESEVFQDVVLGDFQDTYKNLTRKILMGLKWVTKFCSGAQYILKADDDSFIHIPRLIEMLKKNPAGHSGSVYGKLNSYSPVQRTEGKWNVTYEDYPLSIFPPYMSGGAYVLSGNIAGKLLAVSEYMPYLSVEDVFITGILRFIIGGVRAVASFDFAHWAEKEPFPCRFMIETKISANVKSSNLMKEMWLVQHQYEMCGNLRNVLQTEWTSSKDNIIYP